MTSDTHRPPLERIECPDKHLADHLREQWPDLVVDDADDRRRKDVIVSKDALPEWRDRMRAEVERELQSRQARCGQSPLTRDEKLRIDFTRTNTFHARSCKAIAEHYGARDWLAYYDTECTVDEHREIFRRAAGGRGETLREMATEKWFLTPAPRGGAA